MRGSGCGSDKHRDQFGDCLGAFGRPAQMGPPSSPGRMTGRVGFGNQNKGVSLVHFSGRRRPTPAGISDGGPMEGTDSRLVPPADAGTHQIEINNAKRYSMFPIPRGSKESTSSWRSRCPRDRRDHVCPASRPASNVCVAHCGIRLTDTVRSPDLHRRKVQTDDL